MTWARYIPFREKGTKRKSIGSLVCPECGRQWTAHTTQGAAVSFPIPEHLVWDDDDHMSVVICLGSGVKSGVKYD